MERKLIILISSVLSPTSANKKLHYSYLFCLLALPSSIVLLSYLATALTGCDIVPLYWHSRPSPPKGAAAFSSLFSEVQWDFCNLDQSGY